jgi:hypothetical protein
MATDTDIDFRASELVTSAGSGSQGEQLVGFLLDYYPPGLQAAQLKRINPALDSKVDDSFRAKVAKVAGVGRVDQVHVRGGERRQEDAVITYAFLDDEGEVWKGCLPYGELGASKPDGHISQRDSLSSSAIAREHRAAHPRPARSGEPAASQVDPIDWLLNATAEDLVAYMDQHPDRADHVKALEKATKGRSARKTVLEHEPASGNDD